MNGNSFNPMSNDADGLVCVDLQWWQAIYIYIYIGRNVSFHHRCQSSHYQTENHRKKYLKYRKLFLWICLPKFIRKIKEIKIWKFAFVATFSRGNFIYFLFLYKTAQILQSITQNHISIAKIKNLQKRNILPEQNITEKGENCANY